MDSKIYLEMHVASDVSLLVDGNFVLVSKKDLFVDVAGVEGKEMGCLERSIYIYSNTAMREPISNQ